MGRYVVTRAEPGASATAARLAAMGHEPVLAPMLAIRTVPASRDLTGMAGVLFTSANGVRALVEDRPAPAITAWCVGEATAEEARAAGFARIEIAAGTVEALAHHVSLHATPGAGPLLHAAGADLAGDLAGLLRADGFAVETRTFYKAEEATCLPAALDALLAADSPGVDGVLFHSARAAAAFMTCVKAQESLARIAAFCMSDAVADSARRFVWRQVAVAAVPQEAALLALLPRETPH